MLTVVSSSAIGAPEEIQVYMEEFADLGKIGLDFHTIYVPSIRSVGYGNPYHQLRITPELSYGISEHWEVATYFLTNHASHGNVQGDGIKFRTRWRPFAPNEETAWYSAVNIELGRLASRFNSEGSNGEIKGILTWKSAPWAAGVNFNIDRPLRRFSATPATTELDSRFLMRFAQH